MAYIEMNSMHRIGEKLKKYRLQQGLTIAVFAKKAGISAGHYAKIEQGKVPNPIFVTLLKAIRATGVHSSSVLHDYPTVREFFSSTPDRTIKVFEIVERDAFKAGKYWMSYVFDKYPEIGGIIYRMMGSARDQHDQISNLD